MYIYMIFTEVCIGCISIPDNAGFQVVILETISWAYQIWRNLRYAALNIDRS